MNRSHETTPSPAPNVGTPVPLRGCPRCGLVHRLAPSATNVSRCTRCAEVLDRPGHHGNDLAAALALAALILYPLGVALPVLRLEKLGHVHETSILSGSLSLLTHGQIVIGLAVIICSVVIPLLKLAGLLVLCSEKTLLATHHQARIYRWIEIAGRWGMMDVLLVALTVAAVKLGDLVEVTAGPGVIAFTACVTLSLLASGAFNPHAIWQERG